MRKGSRWVELNSPGVSLVTYLALLSSRAEEDRSEGEAAGGLILSIL